MPASIVAGAPRRTRQIRAAVVLLLTLAFLGFAFMKAYSYIQNDSSSASTSSATASDCLTGTAKAPIAKVSTTTVNVYNATPRAGLASSVAKELKTRGYKIGEIANDPLKKKVKIAAEIRYGGTNAPKARAIRLSLKAGKLVKDKRTDDTVDFVIGAKFTRLDTMPTCKKSAN